MLLLRRSTEDVNVERNLDRRNNPESRVGNAGEVERLAMIQANRDFHILRELEVCLPWRRARSWVSLSVARRIKFVRPCYSAKLLLKLSDSVSGLQTAS